MSRELHNAKNEDHVEYYSAVLDSLKRYISDGHSFRLATEIEDEQTEVRLTFESGALGPYLEHLGPPTRGRGADKS